MKKMIFLGMLALSALLYQGCDLTSTNVNPASMSDVELRLILPGAISQAARNQLGVALRVPSVYMKQMDMGDGCINVPNYRLDPAHFDGFWAEGLYGGVLKDCKIIIDKAKEQGQPHYEGIAKVLLADGLGHTTLMFGDIPYSQAFTGEFRLPVFDPQEDVMAEIFRLLDEAIVLLESPAVPGGPAADDLIFGGDASAWLKTARALKARYHMQMSKRDADAASKCLQAIRQGAITSLEEQAYFQWGSSENEHNPLALFATQRPFTMFVHANFADGYMLNDPRRSHYVFDDTSRGIPHLYYYNEKPVLLHWSNPTARIPLISFTEVAFLEAEALWRTGAAASDIQAAMEKGIIANMLQLGIPESDYLPYISSLGRLENRGREAQLSLLMNEAYKAYFCVAGFQSWSNYRRTGYPRITPHPFGSHSLNPNGKIPQRHIYPLNETSTNPDNVAAARERQGGGLMDVPLWIFR